MSKKETKKEPMYDDDLCGQSFVMFLTGKQEFKNKVGHALNHFFDDEWANRTNPKVMKEGFNATRTYNENDIIFFKNLLLTLVDKELSRDTSKLAKLFKGEKK